MVDVIAPRVVSLSAADPLTTDAATVRYTLIFSEPVTGLAPGAFSLGTAAVNGASIAAITPAGPADGTQYTITVNTGPSDGTITLALTGDGVTDLAGNTLGGPLVRARDPLCGREESPRTCDWGTQRRLHPGHRGGEYPLKTRCPGLLGNGDGTFPAQKKYTVGTPPYSVAVSKPERQQRAEIIPPRGVAFPIPHWPGTGKVRFQTPTSYVPRNPAQTP